MRNYKKVILIILLVFFTACSVEYELLIKSDGEVKEKVTAINSKSIYETSDENIKKELNDHYAGMKRNSVYKNHDYKIDILKDTVKHSFSGNYETFDEYYSKSPFANNIYESYEIIEHEKSKTYKTTGYFIPLSEPSPDPMYNLDEIEIKIKFHNRVISTNADYEDKFLNTYTWRIDKNDQEKEITFELANSKRYDIIIIDYLTDYFITYVSVFIIAGVVGISILYVYGYLKRQIRVRNQI